MKKIIKINVTKGIFFIEVPDAKLYVLCGCPADSVKHLMKRGLILSREENNVIFETGPNAVLLSDVLVQNGNFANLAEFPVLQMLYKQGMIIPGHPNNTGNKPMLIGLKEQVDAQMQYIYRGNYGLVSKEEIMATGVSSADAHEIMRMKLKFAFGKIRHAEELLDHVMVYDQEVEIKNGVYIKRLKLNEYEFSYQGDTAIVNMNLGRSESYETPYPLGFHNIKRQYFAVIHSGEGDGWNTNHPCMSSILMFQGLVYLIDAGPNVLGSLMALGIGVNEIEGIFHTHAHDDHFAGFTTLMRADHRIKYFATPLVRASVAKKLSALMSIEEKDLTEYFEVHDLEFDTWNNIAGLEVKPVLSPHPVETSIFLFRTLWENGFRTYAHFADIVSFNILEDMVTEDEHALGVSQEFFQKIKKTYLQKVHIKKLDIGGGMIHGLAEDFREDQSEKIILSHTSTELTNAQKEIGSGAPFGMVDVLIPTALDYMNQYAINFLQSYFPGIPMHELKILLNNQMLTFNPESILIRGGVVNQDVYLVLTGNVEQIQTSLGVHNVLTAGALVGEIYGLDMSPSPVTYRAINFVRALRLPVDLYIEFVKRNQLNNDIRQLQNNREFLQNTGLFGEVVSYPIQNKIAQSMRIVSFATNQELHSIPNQIISMVKNGCLERIWDNKVCETIKSGNFFGEENVIFDTQTLFGMRSVAETLVFEIPGNVLLDIPVVRWKLFEAYQKRLKLINTARQKS